MSLNNKHLILFKNPRDQQQIETLARQMYPAHSEKIIDVYRRATEVPHGSTRRRFKQSTPDSQRLQANIFADKRTKPSCTDFEFEDKHDLSNHTLEDADIVFDDGDSEEEDKAVYDELVDTVWKEYPFISTQSFGID